MGEVSKIKSLTLVPIGWLKKGGVTNGNEIEGGSNTSSRSIKGASSIILNSMERDDSQSS